MLILNVADLACAQTKDDGYRGIWYYNQPSKDEYHYKYSGGFATYPQQMLPYAFYAKEDSSRIKTFFCIWLVIMITRQDSFPVQQSC